jgi:hypothetical protein
MHFEEIVMSSNPLESLVKLALTSKGLTVTQGTLDRYTGLLEAALKADEGQSLEGNVWADFVGGIQGDKFDGVVNAIGQSLGASSSEIAEFMLIASSTGDVLAGKAIELAEEELFAEINNITPTEPEAYSHFDTQSKEAAIAADIGREMFLRKEPNHIAAEEEVGSSDEE